MPITEAEKAAKEVANTIESIRSDVKAQDGKLDGLETKMQGLQETVNKAREEAEAYRKEALNRAVSDDADRSLIYLRTAEEMGGRPMDPRRFVKAKTGDDTLQLYAVKSADGKSIEYGYLDDPDPVDKTQAALQKAVSDRARRRRILAALNKTDVSMVSTPASDREVRLALREVPPAIRKIFSEDPTLHGAFQPINVDPDYERDLMASYGLTSIIRNYPHPGGTLKKPFQDGYLQMFGRSIPTADTGTPPVYTDLPQTQSGDITTKRLSVGTVFDRESDENAIIFTEALLQDKSVDAFRFGEHAVSVHGHVAGTMDTIAGWNLRGRYGVTTNNTDHQLRQWDGFRAYAAADAANRMVDLAGAETYAGFMSLFGKMAPEQMIRSSGASSMILLVGIEYFFKHLMLLDEFKTWDKVGALASILTGNLGNPVQGLPNQVGVLAGRIPVCLEFTLEPSFNAAGVHDGVGGSNKNVCVLLDRDRWEYWTSRNMRVERDIDIKSDTVTLVTRKSMVMRYKQGSHPAAIVGHGLSN
mgnify:CR=1 FL=1